MKPCPYCAEEIQEDAIKCKHCGSMLDDPTGRGTSRPAGSPQLVRSRSDKVLMGVCGGIAKQYGLDPTLVRVLLVVVAIFTSGLPVLIVYLVLGLVLPEGD